MALVFCTRLGKQYMKPIQLTSVFHSFAVGPNSISSQILSKTLPEIQKIFCTLHTMRSHSVGCLNRCTLDNGRIDSSYTSSSLLQRKNAVLLQSHSFKILRSGVVASELTKDIDLEQLKEEVKQIRIREGSSVNVNVKLREIIKEKCDEAVANLNPEEQRRLKVIKLEHDFMYSEGHYIPSPEEMNNENWLEALNSSSKAQRLKYYIFLCKKKHLKKMNVLKKEEKKENNNREQNMNMYEHGKLFMRIYDTTIKKWQCYCLASAMQFGIPLVIDMDYVDHMRSQEIKNTSDQLLDLYSINKADKKMPFHLHFTSCPEDNSIYRLMQMHLQDQVVMATVTEKSYLDLFDKDSLVYLSPQARQVLRKFNPDTTYIIGAFNDKTTQKPVSYARAKEQGIKCMRLPIDEHLTWHQGNKNLTLDQMMKIMMSVKNEKPWYEAFKAIPKRKVRDWQ